MKWLLFFTCVLGCHKSPSHQTDAVSEAFQTKYQLYLNLSRDFPEDNCDWLMFQALTDSARNLTGAINQAEGEPGRWYRTPAHDCFPSGRSKSDISRDMLLGLAVYLWQVADTENVKEVLAYADLHGGIMGDGDESRTAIRPVLYNTYQAILAHTGEIPMPPKTTNPDINADQAALVPGLEDFEAHLLVLHIYLRGLVGGELSSFETQLLQAQADRQPKNAFFQAVRHKYQDGDQTLATEILMDEELFPEDHLPTNEQYCGHWLWERDFGADWEPCVEVREHTGGDWLFAAQVVRNGLREGQ